MLLRLIISRRHAADPSPLHNHAPSLCDDPIRRGSARKATRQPCEGNQRGRQLVNLLRLLPPAVSRQPTAASRQLPSSSLQSVNRQPSTVSPAHHQSDEKPPPSPPNRSADRYHLRRDASGHRPRNTSPIRCGGRSSARGSPKPRQPPPQKVINTPVDNLLITC